MAQNSQSTIILTTRNFDTWCSTIPKPVPLLVLQDHIKAEPPCVMNLIRVPYQKYCYEISKELKSNANMSALPELDASIHGVLVLKQAGKNTWISFVRALKPNKISTKVLIRWKRSLVI